MPNSLAEAHLVSDKVRSGVSYWRVYFPDPITGKRRKISTGIVDDGTPEVHQLAKQLGLELVAKLASWVPSPARKSAPTFGELSKGIWDWDGPRLTTERELSDVTVSREYVKNMASVMGVHVLTFLADTPVDEITSETMEDLARFLIRRPPDGKGLAKSTMKHAILSTTPVFLLAKKQGWITSIPTRDMAKIRGRTRRRDKFRDDEAFRLLNPRTVETVWGLDFEMTWSDDVPVVDARSLSIHGFLSNPHFNPWAAYCVALLVASTGARVSVVLALRREDISQKKQLDGVGEYYLISMVKALRPLEGVTPGTKTGEGVVVPVAAWIVEIVLAHVPSFGPLFPGRGKHGTLSGKTALCRLGTAMRRCGISDHERRQRLLGFHSFRHRFVSVGREEHLSFPQLSGFTEHSDEKTVQIYDHSSRVDLEAAFRVQVRAISGSDVRDPMDSAGLC